MILLLTYVGMCYVVKSDVLPLVLVFEVNFSERIVYCLVPRLLPSLAQTLLLCIPSVVLLPMSYCSHSACLGSDRDNV